MTEDNDLKLKQDIDRLLNFNFRYGFNEEKVKENTHHRSNFQIGSLGIQGAHDNRYVLQFLMMLFFDEKYKGQNWIPVRHRKHEEVTRSFISGAFELKRKDASANYRLRGDTLAIYKDDEPGVSLSYDECLDFHVIGKRAYADTLPSYIFNSVCF